MRYHALAMVPVAMLFALLIVPANADPKPAASEGWKTDFTRHSVPLREIKSGGPPKDGIPAIDTPLFTKVADEKQLWELRECCIIDFSCLAPAVP